MVADCERFCVGRGYCNLHYQRFLRHGDARIQPWWYGLTVEERFWAKTDKRGPDECWFWLAGTRGRPPHVYGSVWDGTYRKSGLPHHVGAHCFSWRLLVGPIPPGMEVCHSCDHGLCVNPAHLFLGTHTDNMQDMMRKGRGYITCGEKNGRAKLSYDEVVEARTKFSGKHGELSFLAREYGVGSGTMSKILKHQTWK